jgi:hypothetical protein
VPAQGEPSPVKVKSVSNRRIAESSAATGVCTGLKSSTFIVVRLLYRALIHKYAKFLCLCSATPQSGFPSTVKRSHIVLFDLRR